MKKIGIILGSVALMSAPVLAQAGPAIAPTEEESALGGEFGPNLFALALVAGIVAMAVLAFTDGDDDEPVSA